MNGMKFAHLDLASQPDGGLLGVGRGVAVVSKCTVT
jgi:hypothetical protein